MGTQNGAFTYLGNSQGQFDPNFHQQLSSYSTHCIRSGDLDGDSFSDLIIGSPLQAKKIFRNNGISEFNLMEQIEATNVVDIAIGDINSDSWNDVIVTNQNEPSSIYYNNGAWDFSDKQTFTEIPAACSVSVMDFDNNSYSEPVLGTGDGTGVILFKNTGNLNGKEIIPFNKYSIGNAVMDLLAGDFNDDNYTDLVIANNEGIYILDNHLGARFKPVLTVDVEPETPSIGSPFQVSVTLKSPKDTPMKNEKVELAASWISEPGSNILNADEDGVAVFDLTAPGDPGDFLLMATVHRNYKEFTVTIVE